MANSDRSIDAQKQDKAPLRPPPVIGSIICFLTENPHMSNWSNVEALKLTRSAYTTISLEFRIPNDNLMIQVAEVDSGIYKLESTAVSS